MIYSLIYSMPKLPRQAVELFGYPSMVLAENMRRLLLAIAKIASLLTLKYKYDDFKMSAVSHQTGYFLLTNL